MEDRGWRFWLDAGNVLLAGDGTWKNHQTHIFNIDEWGRLEFDVAPSKCVVEAT
jgi:hypothetical protein